MSNETRFDEVRAMQERYKRIIREGIKPLDDISNDTQLTERTDKVVFFI